ncbi:MAG: RNA polymerase sigma factor [Desulfobacterales bacterium]|nr:RNA polymerase sigma factor [Desulfobacterales bacterium]
MNTFKDFYSRQRHNFFSYLVRRSGDYDLACEIMQESFTRLIEKYSADQFTPKLLFTIGRNLIYDSLRRKKDNAPLSDAAEPSAVDPNHALLVREEYRRVLAAMKHLEEDERDLITLVVSSDLSYREVADVTGISEANVKVKIHRARKKLRSLMGRER